jgi:hypothetical protein
MYSFTIYSYRRQMDGFSTLGVNDNTIFNKIGLELLNGMAESNPKPN